MLSIRLVLTILALICLFCAAMNISTTRVNFGWLGLFCWLLSVTVA